MRLLSIHTASVEGSIALVDTAMDGNTVTSEMLPGRSSSERLVPAVRRLMEARGWRLKELAAIVVVHGPGSFTGVRVGVSAAKGLCEAGGVPLIAVSRLALLAAEVSGDGVVHAVLDAGRREFYYGQYVGRRCVREAVLSNRDVVSVAAGGAVVVSEAKVAEALVALNPRSVDEPKAVAAVSLAVERFSACEFEDAALLDANYLRRTDIEIFAKSAVRRD